VINWNADRINTTGTSQITNYQLKIALLPAPFAAFQHRRHRTACPACFRMLLTVYKRITFDDLVPES
jgi:hypothetical protein